ncbi:unnamed protein product (mitochondrion) [Plasmodiophora brassicae]|uniref:Uncharacterized protein n=1 Tax=Plasmodiophora brassicae TaxID=37360 RepID=A0A3P3YEA2_PLABS|nr:unnamed protein product [Plasmodiophora brassicae]
MAAWAKALLVMAGTVGGGALGFYWQDHIMREHRAAMRQRWMEMIQEERRDLERILRDRQQAAESSTSPE